MYQLNPALIESTKETSVLKKNNKDNSINNKTYKNRKSVNFTYHDQENNKNTKLKNISNLLSKIHDNENDDEDDEDDNNFNNSENSYEINENINKDLINTELNKMKSFVNNNENNNNNILGNTINTKYANFQDSYKKDLQYLNNLNEKQDTSNYSSYTNYNNNELISKLNYIIHLLEEQHNEKTNHITEELILYLFLGIFIIFVLDSFARASKYIR
tara:strand:+ start:127 stop:774 length:648 start_codon:yes stop_codon:yes gene_type:complete